MLRYAISDRQLYAGDERERQRRVVQQAAALAHEGVDYFQLREKDLDEAALFALTRAVRDAVHATGAPMQVVLNGPRHLSRHARVGWHRAAHPAAEDSTEPSLSCSVHSVAEIEHQRTRSAFLLFAPVFGKIVAGQAVQAGTGLRHLREAVQHAGTTPLLALGGVTLQNAELCMVAGAAGIAGIRLFLR